MRKKKLKIALFGIVLGIFIFLIYPLLLDPITTTFNINANTERLSIISLDQNDSQLNLEDVTIYGKGLKLLHKGFNGQSRPNKGVSVTIERVAYGTATLTFRAPQGEKTGSLYGIEENFVAHTGNYIDIEISNLRMRADSGRTVIFTFNGMVNLGRSPNRPVSYESTALLRSGTINMTGTSEWSDNFDAGTIQLYSGDEIVFDDKSGKGIGFITLNENLGMQAVYRVIAKQATILKTGPKMNSLEESGLNVSATSLDRVLRASLFQIISLCFSILVAGFNLVAFLMDAYINKKLFSDILR